LFYQSKEGFSLYLLHLLYKGLMLLVLFGNFELNLLFKSNILFFFGLGEYPSHMFGVVGAPMNLEGPEMHQSEKIIH
jgi:hypothetical protein